MMNDKVELLPVMHNEMGSVSGWRFLVGYSLLSLLYAISLVILFQVTQRGFLDEMLIFMVPPIFYGSFHYTRGIYLITVSIFFLLCYLVIQTISPNPSGTIITLLIITLVILGSTELVYQSRQNQRKAAEALYELNQSLEQRIQERTHSLHRSQEELRVMASKLSLAEQTERRHIASELHDYLAQMLIVCRMKTDQMTKEESIDRRNFLVAEVRNLLDQSIQYTRTLMAELSPKVLYDSGFTAAVRWLAEQMQQHNLKIDVQEINSPLPISQEKSFPLFQSVRELLYNILKHAQTDCAEIRISWQAPHGLTVHVQDYGIGFDPANIPHKNPAQDHFGLHSVLERIEGLGGTIQIVSSPGQGTSITIKIPLS